MKEVCSIRYLSNLIYVMLLNGSFTVLARQSIVFLKSSNKECVVEKISLNCSIPSNRYDIIDKIAPS